MSKIGPRPLLDSLIRLDDGCYEPCFIYIDIQFGQIPIPQWPCSSIGQLWIAVWLVYGCIGLARLRRRTLVIRESMGDWAVGVWKVLTVIRKLNVDQKYRKCESEYKNVII